MSERSFPTWLAYKRLSSDSIFAKGSQDEWFASFFLPPQV
jgi:hypothetical protein